MPDDFPFNVRSFVQTLDVCAESSMTDERRAGFKFIGEGNYYERGGLKLKRKGKVSSMSYLLSKSLTVVSQNLYFKLGIDTKCRGGQRQRGA